MIWDDYFYYQKGQLFWKVNRGKNKVKDKRAGREGNRGYRQVRLHDKLYQEHRIIWELCNGAIPLDLEIDHIDRNKANNFIENLRVSTKSQNQLNKSMSGNNSSGFKGVYIRKQTKKYVAQITIKGKSKYIGSYNTAIAASYAYEAYLESII